MLTGLLFLLAIVLFFVILRPLMQDLSSQENAIKAKEADIQLLEAQLESMQEQLTGEDPEQLVLEKKIPMERKLDEYILSLEQLENKTNSQIDQIEFTYDSSFELVGSEVEEKSEESDESVDDDGEDESAVNEEIIQDKLDGMQVMTVRFTATSPSFHEFINLLKTIENEERISIVSNLHFTQPTEYDIGEDQEDAVSFNVHLTTFYYTK